jgi:hypothetical protein
MAALLFPAHVPLHCHRHIGSAQQAVLIPSACQFKLGLGVSIDDVKSDLRTGCGLTVFQQTGR